MFLFQLPEEARELEKELRQITKEKNEAVRSQDFEKVKLFFVCFHGFVLILMIEIRETCIL